MLFHDDSEFYLPAGQPSLSTNRHPPLPHPLPTHLFSARPLCIYHPSIHPSLYLSHLRAPGLADWDMHYSSARPRCHCGADLWAEGRRAALQSISQGSDTRHNGVCWLDVRISMRMGRCRRGPVCRRSDYPGTFFTPATVCGDCWYPAGRWGHLFSTKWNRCVHKEARNKTFFL